MNKWRISFDQGLVVVEFDSETPITDEMFIEIYRTLNSDPQKYRITNAVYDMRNIVLDENINFKNLFEMVKQFEVSRESWWKHEKTALVVNSKVAYGISRMYATLAQDQMGYEVQIFVDDLQAAIEWAQPSG